jgi:type II restriction enzyme
MAWLEDLDDRIRRKWKVGETFRIEEVYQMESDFARRHPKNRHVRDKLRQLLQYLRDDDVLEFVDDAGTYKRLK